jgi:hypothetical protein
MSVTVSTTVIVTAPHRYRQKERFIPTLMGYQVTEFPLYRLNRVVRFDPKIAISRSHDKMRDWESVISDR